MQVINETDLEMLQEDQESITKENMGQGMDKQDWAEKMIRYKHSKNN